MTIANARWGAYGDHALAGPVRSIPPEHVLAVTHTGAVPRILSHVTNDEMAQRTQFPDPRTSSYVHPARVATSEPTFTLRPMHWRAPWFNGMHGVISRLRPGTWNDRQRPMYRPLRTLRSAPATTWDVGTALGPSGRSEGIEG